MWDVCLVLAAAGMMRKHDVGGTWDDMCMFFSSVVSGPYHRKEVLPLILNGSRGFSLDEEPGVVDARLNRDL